MLGTAATLAQRPASQWARGVTQVPQPSKTDVGNPEQPVGLEHAPEEASYAPKTSSKEQSGVTGKPCALEALGSRRSVIRVTEETWEVPLATSHQVSNNLPAAKNNVTALCSGYNKALVWVLLLKVFVFI